MSTIKGECCCGKVQIEIPRPSVSGFCHCTDCRKTGGGPASLNVRSPREEVKLSGTKPKSFHTIGESGGEVERFFCGDCGSPIFANAVNVQAISYIRAGLFQPGDIPRPKTEMFTRRFEHWESPYPGVTHYEGEPAH